MALRPFYKNLTWSVTDVWQHLQRNTDLILTFSFLCVDLAAVTKGIPAPAVARRAISQSLAVDETIMPPAADNSTVYLADTEIEKQTW